MTHLFKTWLLVTLLWSLAGGFQAAFAQIRIPANSQPGAIMQHNNQSIQMQQQNPWLSQPMTPAEITAPPTLNPEIEKIQSIQGEILPRPADETIPNPAPLPGEHSGL